MKADMKETPVPPTTLLPPAPSSTFTLPHFTPRAQFFSYSPLSHLLRWASGFDPDQPLLPQYRGMGEWE